MQLVRNINNYQKEQEGIVLTIGNFDGLHRGHQEILKHLLAESEKAGLKSAVMCFEPQPLEFFKTNSPARLSRFRDKFLGFKNFGVDIMFCLRFNQTFAKISPEDFIENILVRAINIKKIIVGDDFRFGALGKGDFNLLQVMGKQKGFEAVSLESYIVENQRVSSTLIRQNLKLDKLENIKSLLGEDFFIRGKVAHGQEIGRTISFPTANINLNRRVTPVKGVYAVRVELKKGEWHNGVANVGVRPTVNGVEPRLDVFIFAFSGDLYCHEIKVSFIKKLRDEKKFSSVDELKNQIKLDEDFARKILA